eukprot:TRINITY_DN1101_c0_g2_i3.p1 TRINITY_DN1101_c0_g2~~TRINITY_DN1101_c0_g2_i3.p1  ORF type:complete len:184 (+),score=35.32 TRINITY_DN1101_c0_g2_i3:95-646(+)
MKHERSMHGVGGLFHGLTALSVLVALLVNYFILGDMVVPWVPKDFLRGMGLAMLIIGCFILKLAMGQIKPAFKKKVLLTDGLYSLCRNPAEGSWIFLVLPGIALLSCRVVMVAPVILQPLIFLYLLPREEAELENEFGDAYRKYREKVPKLIPSSPQYCPLLIRKTDTHFCLLSYLKTIKSPI